MLIGRQLGKGGRGWFSPVRQTGGVRIASSPVARVFVGQQGELVAISRRRKSWPRHDT